MAGIVSHEQKKEILIERITEQIESGNLTSFSLREIAKRLGLTTGAVYGYFKNKSELVEAVVRHITLKEMKPLQERFSLVMSRKEKFMMIIQHVKQTQDVLRRRYLLYINYRHENPQNESDDTFVDPVLNATDEYASLAAEQLEVSIEQGRFMMTFIIGFVLRNYLVFGGMDIERQAETMFQILFNTTDTLHAEC